MPSKISQYKFIYNTYFTLYKIDIILDALKTI